MSPSSPPLRILSPLRLIALGLLGGMFVACGGKSTNSTTNSTGSLASMQPAVSAPSPTATPVPSPRVAGQPGIVDVVFIDASHGWLVRGVSGEGQLFVTDDGGTSWTKQYASQTTPQSVQFTDALNGWAAGCVLPVGLSGDCETQLLATIDGGITWTPAISAPITQGKVVSIGFVGPRDGWVLGKSCPSLCDSQAPAKLVRTGDGGATWESLPVLDGVAAPVSLERLDELVGWVLTNNQIFGTRDGGVTWTTAENPCNEEQPRDSKVLPTQMSFVDAQVGWIGCFLPIGAGMSAGALYRTGDGGATWQLVAITPEGSTALPSGVGILPTGVVDVDFLNERNGWFACGCPYSGVWQTQDGGSNWDRVDLGSSGVGHVLFVDEAHGWAWGLGALSKTTDGGAHWQDVQLPQ